MRIFLKNCSKEHKLNCIQKMLENLFEDLVRTTDYLDPITFCVLMYVSNNHKTFLSQILSAIEKHQKVIIAFNIIRQRGFGEQDYGEVTYEVLIADKMRWSDYLDNIDSDENGMGIIFRFDDMNNSPWYFATEEQMKGWVLAKVLN